MVNYKAGLDCFLMDCHTDESIRLIEMVYGLKGFAIIVKLYQKIFGEYGYYCEWNDNSALVFAVENGLSKKNINLISQVVLACIKRNIFSEKLYKEFGILTSEKIQKKYMSVVSNYRRDKVEEKYLLVGEEREVSRTEGE